MSKPINWIKFSSRRTDQTTENNFDKKWQSVCFRESEEAKGMNKNSEKELLQSPRIGIENYSRKAFATHLSDNHLTVN